MAKRPLPSPELLRQLLRYEPDTGRLFWRERGATLYRGNHGFRKKWNETHAGTEAFTCISAQGYLVGTLLNIRMYAHRVIVAMVTGEWPIAVDHGNGMRDDNRWSNLAATTTAENNRNQKLHSRNQSDVAASAFTDRLVVGERASVTAAAANC